MLSHHSEWRCGNGSGPYLPHGSPLPHSEVEWISFMSLSCLTRREAKSFSVISATARARREEFENVLALSHCAWGLAHIFVRIRDGRTDGDAMVLVYRGSKSIILLRKFGSAKVNRLDFGQKLGLARRFFCPEDVQTSGPFHARHEITLRADKVPASHISKLSRYLRCQKPCMAALSGCRASQRAR